MIADNLIWKIARAITDGLNLAREKQGKDWDAVDCFWNWEEELIVPIADKVFWKLKLPVENRDKLLSVITEYIKNSIVGVNLWCVKGYETDDIVEFMADEIMRRYLE